MAARGGLSAMRAASNAAHHRASPLYAFKEVVFVLRADHDGEGGMLALQALARQAVAARWLLFGLTRRNAGRASDDFPLPHNRLVEMGRRT